MPALVDVALVFHHPSNIMPACPNQYGNRTVVTVEPRSREGEIGFVDRSICVLFAACSERLLLDDHGLQKEREWSHKSALLFVCISGGHRKACMCPRAICTSAGCRNIVLSPRNQWMRFVLSWCSSWTRPPHENCPTQHGICLHTQTRIKASGKRTVCLTPLEWPSTWAQECTGIQLALHDTTGRYQGMVRVLKFEGHMLAYDPLTNGAGWIPMRGSFLITHGSRVMIRWQSGKLLPLPLCGTSRPGALATSSHGASHKIRASQGLSHHSPPWQNRSDLLHGTLKKCEISCANQTLPAVPHDAFVGWGSGGDPTNKTESAPGGRVFHGIRGGIAPRLCPNNRDHRENTTGRGHREGTTYRTSWRCSHWWAGAHPYYAGGEWCHRTTCGDWGPWLVPCGIKLVIKLMSVNNIKCQIWRLSCRLIAFLNFYPRHL